MSFVFASWNVEHFRGGAARLTKVANFIKSAHPGGKPVDIFGILEVEDVNMTVLIQDHFQDFDFYLTDGAESQEIMIGVRRGVFDQKAFVQKREFRAGNDRLRPGAFLSVRQGAKWWHLLYLHTDSGVDADAFGNRFNMFNNVRKMKDALDKKEQQVSGDPQAEARLLVMGDFNTMGLQYPQPRKANVRIAASDEIAELPRFAGLRVASKTHAMTWTGSAGDSDLDHVMVTAPVKLKSLGAGPPVKEVCVTGWVGLAGAKKKAFLDEISDHCLLVGEVA
jgi:hypothetical protein